MLESKVGVLIGAVVLCVVFWLVGGFVFQASFAGMICVIIGITIVEARPGETCASKCECGCPIEKATEMWSCAFCEAKRQVAVEILKDKIQKAWGSKMEKVADAVLAAKDAEWKAMLAKGKAKMELKDQMLKILAKSEK